MQHNITSQEEESILPREYIIPYTPYGAYGLSACRAIGRQVQARTSVRMNSVKAYVMPYHTVHIKTY